MILMTYVRKDLSLGYLLRAQPDKMWAEENHCDKYTFSMADPTIKAMWSTT